MTGYAEDKTDRFADFVHADEVLRKPFTEEDVLPLFVTLGIAFVQAEVTVTPT